MNGCGWKFLWEVKRRKIEVVRLCTLLGGHNPTVEKMPEWVFKMKYIYIYTYLYVHLYIYIVISTDECFSDGPPRHPVYINTDSKTIQSALYTPILWRSLLSTYLLANEPTCCTSYIQKTRHMYVCMGIYTCNKYIYVYLYTYIYIFNLRVVFSRVPLPRCPLPAYSGFWSFLSNRQRTSRLAPPVGGVAPSFINKFRRKILFQER